MDSTAPDQGAEGSQLQAPVQTQAQAQAQGGALAAGNGAGLAGWLESDQCKRWLSWTAFGAVCVVLRSFFSIILGTYIMTLVGNQCVNLAERLWASVVSRLPDQSWGGPSRAGPWYTWLRKPPRKAFCGAYILGVVTLLTTVSVLTVPRLIREGQYVVSKVSGSEDPYLYVASWLHEVLGDGPTGKLETFLDGQGKSSFSDQIFSVGTSSREVLSARDLDNIQRDIAKGMWSSERADRLAGHLERLLKGNVRQGLSAAKATLDLLASCVVNAGACLLFSFLLVLDLPRISRGVRSLGQSRLAFAYREIAPKVASFSSIVGTAFEIQILLAIINTVLTYAGMAFLQLPATGFLSVVVFFCTFIPVAGIALSTVPMLLVALSEFGVAKCGEVLGMVAAVHALEAYLVYPPLYAHKLKLHPLLVLVTLFVTEHLVGVQGLFLALPVTVFVTKMIYDSDSDSKEDDPKKPAVAPA